ncbi:tetratricopeptide repeat protein [Aggregatimonas sangjinii]|uniref:Tetratricopeptide repeat protein n=1 Tax=Aggregatimonas sangjinii TaxID=2583587 RepID=A0A5B7SSJ2_9FLAO|nr:DUF6340 family protein [Aggregatimonas sangjinii]QCW99982.1 tetratricopeptide repeat protein [Aggregatimonas sangjinii]
MKKYVYRFLVLGILVNFMSCSTTQQLVLTTMEPSPVVISNSIKKIGIIDRSAHIAVTKGTNKIDQILAAEEKWLTENGTDAAITGLFDELLKDDRFEIVKLLENVPEDVLAMGATPDAIAWSSITALCETNGIDAVFSLAFYDADTKVSLKKTKMQQADMMRELQEVSAQELTLETFIENGWRIYDPMNQRLVDEIVFNDQIISKGTGVNPVLAYRAIGDRKETMLKSSRNTGSTYGQRLLPSENSVSREYFVKGSEKMVYAAEKASAGNWQEASALWNEETENPNAKVRSRAYHNLAVAHERMEELENALSLETKAYEIQDDKLYLNYIDTLQKRIADQSLLQQQMVALEFSK